MSNYDIFISYREKGGVDIAKKIYDDLVREDYKVSFASNNFNTGSFVKQIFERLKSCTDFVIILDEHVFDRCLDRNLNPKDDWLRKELAYALKNKKNIICLECVNFKGFPDNLPADIANIKEEMRIKYNTIIYDSYTYPELKNNLKTLNNKSKANNYAKKILLSIPIIIISIYALFSFFHVKFNSENTSSYKNISYSKNDFKQNEYNYNTIGIQNIPEIVKMYEKSAKLGNIDAMNYIGSAYYWGNGVPKNYYKAVEFYTKAAKNGNVTSMYNLGHCYLFGNGIKKDYFKAVYWFKKAAHSGNTSAMYNLGHCYKYGKGISKDYFKAAIWNMKAAELGNTFAMNEIGNCYFFGTGLSKNYSKALEWYKKAAIEGNLSALKNVIICYERGYGVSVNQSVVDSLRKAVKEEQKGNSEYAKMLVCSTLQ